MKGLIKLLPFYLGIFLGYYVSVRPDLAIISGAIAGVVMGFLILSGD
jgi:hypothetical protein